MHTQLTVTLTVSSVHQHAKVFKFSFEYLLCVYVCCYSYGPIYAVSLGSVSCVVLNNMCTISDAFETKAHIFSDRPNWLPLMNLIYQERGTIYTIFQLSLKSLPKNCLQLRRLTTTIPPVNCCAQMHNQGSDTRVIPENPPLFFFGGVKLAGKNSKPAPNLIHFQFFMPVIIKDLCL